MLRRTTILIALLSLLLAALTAAPASAGTPARTEKGRTEKPAAEPTTLPAGMQRFVVAIGKVDADSRENWVRLGTYDFAEDGTVTESHWHWTQRRRDTRTETGVQASGCKARECVVQTAKGFESAKAPQTLEGTYEVDGSTLRITLADQGTEEWKLDQPIDGKLARLTYHGSSYGATHGGGFGSNAGWTDRASMGEVAAFDHSRLEHVFDLWKTDGGTPQIDHGEGDPFWITDWTECAGNRCLGAVSDTPTSFYLSRPNNDADDRRDTLWHWREELADGRDEYCYTGNSHVKPMLQIIDSDGGFHGWVGAEASLNQSSPDEGTDADDIGIFTIAEY